MPRQKSAHLGLVFLGREGTGGITQQAAGPVALRPRRPEWTRPAPRIGPPAPPNAGAGLRLLAEHPLAGTGARPPEPYQKCRKCRRHTRGALSFSTRGRLLHPYAPDCFSARRPAPPHIHWPPAVPPPRRRQPAGFFAAGRRATGPTRSPGARPANPPARWPTAPA